MKIYILDSGVRASQIDFRPFLHEGVSRVEDGRVFVEAADPVERL